MLRLSNIVVFLLLLSISSSYLIGTFGRSMAFIDDLATVAIVLLMPTIAIALFKTQVKGLNNGLFVIVVFFYIATTFLLLFSSPFPHIYELYKLLTFMAFIPLFMVLTRLSIYEIDHKFLMTVSILLAVNTIIVILQYTVSPSIINAFGMNVNASNNIAYFAGRYGGLFSNPNNLADLALLVYLLNEIIQPEKYKLFRLISMLAVITSSSKHAIIILLLIFMYQHRDMILKNIQKFMTGFIFVMVAGFLTYSLNQTAFDAKLDQYTRILTAEDTDRIKMGTVESRAQKTLKGMKLVDQYFPLGTGLGTWGDASSNFNTNNHLKYPEKMSDSAFMHILVEQGIFIFMYLLLVFLGYLSVIKVQRKYFVSLFLIFVLASFPTMGMSSGGWPLIFAYLYARLFFSRYIEGNRV